MISKPLKYRCPGTILIAHGPPMSSTIIEHVIQGHEFWLCFSAAFADISTISHDCFMSDKLMTIATSFIVRLNPVRIVAIDSAIFFATLLLYTFLVRGLPFFHVGLIARRTDTPFLG